MTMRWTVSSEGRQSTRSHRAFVAALPLAAVAVVVPLVRKRQCLSTSEQSRAHAVPATRTRTFSPRTGEKRQQHLKERRAFLF